MITKEDIITYIQKIPPAPKAMKQTIALLQVGELKKASEVAKEDRAFASYLKDLLNKPIYGFTKEVSDITQIFSILGISKSLQTVYNYLLSLLSPKEWSFFALDKNSFYELQADLLASWNNILSHLGVEDKEIESAITILPASVIVCEALFSEHKKDVELIRSTKDLDLNEMLERLSGFRLFSICELIAKKWEMSPKIVTILEYALTTDSSGENELKRYGKWMHLLLFYTLSKPRYIQAELNDFLAFEVEFVEDIYEEFTQIMEIEQ